MEAPIRAQQRPAPPTFPAVPCGGSEDAMEPLETMGLISVVHPVKKPIAN